MIAGHFGLAALVKSRARRVPLWALMLATVWLDVIFVPLFLAGIEPIEPLPGTSGGYGEGIIHADYTHSLVGALLIAAVFGLLAAIRWRREVALVLGAVVFSHWLLDLPMHRGDMSIFPHDHFPRLGFGLWRLPAVSAAVELIIVVAGTLLYWRAAVQVTKEHAPSNVGRAHLAAGSMLAVGVLTLVLNVLGN